eukprot:TRINITY_DN1291_c0_g2_i1.p1 TRINITY_DN1291_c0_g2~~TRINITY_DN1291_c0_g2_i1.p1  ORF type:complete len:486 (-),score=113.17 TRINITY_DN1291_c0_g2_i1:116-1573(-)
MSTLQLKDFGIVVAACHPSGGIGANGTLPWSLPGDLSHFKKVTSQTDQTNARNAIIMGRKTWDSIPPNRRPLPNRLNVIISSSLENEARDPNVEVARSFADALELVSLGKYKREVDKVFVIGGAQVYSDALQSPHCKTIYLTKIFADIPCDTFLPAIDPAVFQEMEALPLKEENSLSYQILRMERKQPTVQPLIVNSPVHEEYQYLDLIRRILDEGVDKSDRTGVGTLSLFGAQMRFSLKDSFPLLTTKRVFWRGVAEELLWFISGNTSAKTLQDKNIRIWDGNSSREYLDKIGLSHREVGDLGPVYGFQWRHFGAAYETMHTDYTGKGHDQLKEIIETLKRNPNDRRMVMSAWNPPDIQHMALPPCHILCQFYVANGELSCQMYQRSCDMGLGVPFNIASYALLTCLIAQVTGLKPGEFIHTLGDAHIYKNHVEPLRQQLLNKPRPFPKLKLNPTIQNIDEFTFQDLTLEDYDPYATISMQMAV